MIAIAGAGAGAAGAADVVVTAGVGTGVIGAGVIGVLKRRRLDFVLIGVAPSIIECILSAFVLPVKSNDNVASNAFKN